MYRLSSSELDLMTWHLLLSIRLRLEVASAGSYHPSKDRDKQQKEEEQAVARAVSPNRSDLARRR